MPSTTESDNAEERLGEQAFTQHLQTAELNSQGSPTPEFLLAAADLRALVNETNRALGLMPADEMKSVFRGYQHAALRHLNRCVLDGRNPLLVAAGLTVLDDEDIAVLRRRSAVLHSHPQVSGLPPEIAALLAVVLAAQADLGEAVAKLGR